MSNPQDLPLPDFDFRKRFSNQFQLRQLRILSEQWGGITLNEVCCRLITDGIVREKDMRETIIHQKNNNEVPYPKYNPPGKEA